MIEEMLKKLMNHESLREEETRQFIDKVAEGNVSEIVIAAFLTALSLKGESAEEIIGFAKSMRSKSTMVKRFRSDPLIDLCGTGGDGQSTFNISTISSFVVAGAGLTVSKHGNRAITSECGSADVLEKLGVNLLLTPDQVGLCLDEVGIAFLFAPSFHPVMKYIMPIRNALNFRTVFNILGPLLSPVKADYQLMGVFDKELTEKIAQVFIALGTKAGMVVHGNDGLDEITVTNSTQIAEFNLSQGERVDYYTFDPQTYGHELASLEDILGGDADRNAAIFKEILDPSGHDTSTMEKNPKFNIVVFNAAAALKIAGKAMNFEEGIEQAKESIFSGRAFAKLNELIQFSQKF